MTAMRMAAGSAAPGASPKAAMPVAAMPVAAVVCVCVRKRRKFGGERTRGVSVGLHIVRRIAVGVVFRFFVCFVVLFEQKRRTTMTYYVKRKTGQSVRT